MEDDGPTLVEILDGAEPAPQTEQALISSRLAVGFSGPTHPARLLRETGDPLASIVAWAAQMAGRLIGTAPLWVRYHRMDESRGLVVVVHAPVPAGEADLLVFGEPGVISRSVLRATAAWAFGAAGLRRLVARIPANRPDLQEYARRAGFHHEGTARGFFPDGSDASAWAMTADRCPWLPQAPTFAPDLTPPTSDRRH